MKPLKESVSITLDPDVLAATRAAAEEDDRALSQYINLVLRKHLNLSPSEKSIDERENLE